MKKNLLTICSLLIFSLGKAQFSMRETQSVCDCTFMSPMEELNYVKPLKIDETKGAIMVIKPYFKKIRTDYSRLYKELGYQEVIEVVPPMFASTKYRDSLKELCKSKNVIMVAQVSYFYSFHMGITIGKVKRGWNEIISYSIWDPRNRNYTGTFVSGASRDGYEAVKKEYLNITSEK